MNQIDSGDPQTVDIVKELLRAILAQPNAHEVLLSLDSRCIPPIMEALQSEASSNRSSSGYLKSCLRCLRALVTEHYTFPSSLFLRDINRVGTHPLRGGAFSDIWKGFFEGEPVALKVMRIHLEADEKRRNKIAKAFCEEAVIWKQLEHPHILPMLGVNTELFSPAFCLVSPWMDNGDIITYLKENPACDRLRFVYEIASGLAYLHSLEPNVIHGDIKGANILVDSKHSCRLADFGLATVIETQRIDSTTSSATRGTFRWMAPEMFVPRDENDTENSEAKWPRDIYAFACTVFEIMTGEPPFLKLREAAVMFQVIAGLRPARPVDGWCPDKVWRLVEQCWAQDPGMRPRAARLERTLKRAVNRLNKGQGGTDQHNATTDPRRVYLDSKSSPKYIVIKSSSTPSTTAAVQRYPIEK